MSGSGGYRRVAVISEGHGDCHAVIDLLAKASKHVGINNIIFDDPPIRSGGVGHIVRNIEALTALATLRDSAPDFLIIVVDCDDECVVDAAKRLVQAMRDVQKSRAVIGGAVCLIRREFESLFLAGLNGIKEKLPGCIGAYDDELRERCEEYRDAKGKMDEICTSGYKPTRDQRPFTKALGCDEVEPRNHSFRHILSALRWLLETPPATRSVYPDFPPRAP